MGPYRLSLCEVHPGVARQPGNDFLSVCRLEDEFEGVSQHRNGHDGAPDLVVPGFRFVGSEPDVLRPHGREAVS